MQEKSWHFDSSTDRKAALAHNPKANYLILDATEKDTQKATSFYKRSPVPGYGVTRVEVIYNRDFNIEFNLQLKKLQNKRGNPTFSPKWQAQMSEPVFRQQIHAWLEKISQPHTDPKYPDVKLIPAWHGTKPESLESIFTTGYSNLAITDNGFFGKGLYSTYEAEYAHRVYSKGALILNWVACFSALPVIDGDMDILKGKGNYGNYDAHFVPVVPADPNNLNEKTYYPCKPGQAFQYIEMVVFQTAACLPRYLVTLGPVLLKSPALSPEDITPKFLSSLSAGSAISASQNLSGVEEVVKQEPERQVQLEIMPVQNYESENEETRWEKLDQLFKKSLNKKDMSVYAKILCMYAVGKIFNHAGYGISLKSYFTACCSEILNFFKEIDNISRDEKIRLSLRNFIGEKLQRDLGLDLELPLEDRHYYRLDDEWEKFSTPLANTSDPLGYLFGPEACGGYNYSESLEKIIEQDPQSFSAVKYVSHLLRFSLPLFSRRLAQRFIRQNDKQQETAQFFAAINLTESLIHYLLLHQKPLPDPEKKRIYRFYEACFICQKELVLPLKSSSDVLDQLISLKNHYLPGSVLKQQHLAILLDRFLKDYKGISLSEVSQKIILDIFAEEMIEDSKIPLLYIDALKQFDSSRTHFLGSQTILKAQALNTRAIKALLNSFLIQSIGLLGGLPPCEVGLMLLGSSSRYDRLPYSDVEMVLLYDKPSEIKSLERKQHEVNHYIAALLALLEFQIIYLGESHVEKQGFWLDSSTSFRQYVYLRNSPRNVLKELYEKEKDTQEWQHFPLEKNPRRLKMHSLLYDPSAYSLIQPDLINTLYGGQSLFATYQTYLADYLNKETDQSLLAALMHLVEKKMDVSSVRLKKREAIALWVWWDVLRLLEDHFSSQDFDFKKVLHKPIAYLALGIRLYYAIQADEANSLETILITAVNRKILSISLGDFLLRMLEWVVSQRIVLHFNHQKQIETLSLAHLDVTDQHRIIHLINVFKIFQNAVEYGFAQLPRKNYGLALDVLISDYFLDSLQRCNTAEDYQNWFIQVSLYLLYTKALLETHRYYYRQLPEAQREGCLNSAADYFSEKPDNSYWRGEPGFWKSLWDAPLPNGCRRKHSYRKQHWEKQLSTLLMSEPEPALSKGLKAHATRLNGKKYQLSLLFVNDLLVHKWINFDGKFIDKIEHPIAKNMPGNHLVIPWPLDNPQWYFKIYPEYPLVELFLNELTCRLGYFEPREVELWLWESGEYSYPVLVSEAVPGQSLQTLLKKNVPLSLNAYAFCQSVVVSSLISLEDSKPDNTIVFHDEEAGYRLCLIDADRWFAPTFKNNLLHAKDILFCLPHMSDALDLVFREDFLCLNPQQVLQAWLDRMEQLGDQCIQVFGEKIESYFKRRAEDRKTLLLPPLKFHAVQTISEHIQILQDILASASVQRQLITHWKLLSCINTRQANHYLLAHEKHKRALERFEYAAGHAYIRGKDNQSEYFTSKIDFKTQMQDMWEGLPSEGEIRSNWIRDIKLARDQHIGLMEGVQKIREAQDVLKTGNLTRFRNLSLHSQEKLLNALNWEELTPSVQRTLLVLMVTKGHWLNLIIKNSSVVQDEDMTRLLQKSPSLQRLVLINTPQISDGMWSGLPENDSLLQLIHLENLPNMKYMGYVGKFLRYYEKVLMLPNLQELSIIALSSMSSYLNQININAPLLKKLTIHIPLTHRMVEPSVDLKVIQTRSQALETIDIKGWGSFDDWHLMMQESYTHCVNIFKCEYIFGAAEVLLLMSQCPVLLAITWKNYNSEWLKKVIPRLKVILADIQYELLPATARQMLLKSIKILLETSVSYENLLLRIQKALEQTYKDPDFSDNKSQIRLSDYEVNLKIPFGRTEILKYLQGEDVELRIQAAAALEFTQESKFNVSNILLWEILESKDLDPEFSVQVATVVLKRHPVSDEAVQCLLMGLKDKDPLIRIRAARGLQFVKEVSIEVMNALIQALQDEDSYVVRIQAAFTLEVISEHLGKGIDQLFHDLKENTLKNLKKSEKPFVSVNTWYPRDGIFNTRPRAVRPPLPDPEVMKKEPERP